MRIACRYLTVPAAVAVALTFLTPVHAETKPSPTPTPAPKGLIVLQPERQAGISDPLSATAHAVNAVGKGPMRQAFTKVYIDAPGRSIDLYMKDPARAEELLRRAKARDPNIDTATVKVKTGAYSIQQLHSSRKRILRAGRQGQLPFQVHGIGVTRDGSSLNLRVSDPGAAARATRQKTVTALSEVALTFTKSSPVRPAYNRFDAWQPEWDSNPEERHFGAGLRLRFAAGACTSGIPARLKGQPSQSRLVSAFHCGVVGTTVTTGVTTHRVGTAVSRSEQYDAVSIDVSPGYTNAFAALEDHQPDGIFGFMIGGFNGVVNGLVVCQNGYTSYTVEGMSICDIEVTDDDYSYNLCPGGGRPCYNVTGAEGRKMGGTVAVRNGDSGGLVYRYRYSGDINPEAVGIVSAGSDGDKLMQWTPAPQILEDLGLELAPW